MKRDVGSLSEEEIRWQMKRLRGHVDTWWMDHEFRPIEPKPGTDRTDYYFAERKFKTCQGCAGTSRVDGRRCPTCSGFGYIEIRARKPKGGITRTKKRKARKR